MSEYQTELEFLNDEAIFKTMKTLKEVDSLKTARIISEQLAVSLAKQANIPKSKIKYVCLEIKHTEQRYVAMGISLNGAIVLVRASNLDTGAYYIPEEVYAVMSHMEGDQEVSEVLHIGGTGPGPTEIPEDVVEVIRVPIDYGNGNTITVPDSVEVKFSPKKSNNKLKDIKMSKMNFTDWPFVDMMDFKAVVVDATRWDEGEYTAMLNFYHTIAESESEKSSGFTIATHIGGDTLREVYQKITTILMMGLFDGSSVQAHGTLYSESGDEIANICWHQYSDDSYDDEEDDDMVGLFDEEDATAHSAPVMLQ
jgi:hypothetical protein